MRRNKQRFNILDAAVVIIVLFLLAGSFIRHQINTVLSASEKNGKAIITVTVNDVDKNLSQYVKKGDTVRLSQNASVAGKVVSVVNRNNKIYVPVQEENVYSIDFDDSLYRVLIKIEAEVYESENGVFLRNNRFIAPGVTLDFETPSAMFNGTIVDITRK